MRYILKSAFTAYDSNFVSDKASYCLKKNFVYALQDLQFCILHVFFLPHGVCLETCSFDHLKGQCHEFFPKEFRLPCVMRLCISIGLYLLGNGTILYFGGQE